MTMIKGEKQHIRDGGNAYGIGWDNYLERIIEIDTTINSVCIRLDEEGNDYLEMTPKETKVFIKVLEQRIGLLE